MTTREKLVTAIKTHLNYDSLLNTEFGDPFDKKQAEKINIEANKIADIFENIKDK